ncbi:MAG: hypothetical protein ACI35P_01970 [Bacillus sp. (in: firmicutes)]
MQQRLLFCLLVIGIMLYYAVPQLNFYGTIEERIFAVAWLFFAVCTVGGNISAVLYGSSKKRHVQKVKKNGQLRKRMNNY